MNMKRLYQIPINRSCTTPTLSLVHVLRTISPELKLELVEAKKIADGILASNVYAIRISEKQMIALICACFEGDGSSTKVKCMLDVLMIRHMTPVDVDDVDLSSLY
jgi:transcriptional regulatory protein LevR